MKKTLSYIILLLILASCQKTALLTLSGSNSYLFTEQGGVQTVSFSCNRDWHMSSPESWVRVSPSSGQASDGTIVVALTCDANTTYDDRSCTIMLSSEGLTESIFVTQETGHGLLVTPSRIELSQNEQSIEVEVQQNVPYTIEIDPTNKGWITLIDTKALSIDKVAFNISANNSYICREGKIFFRQKDGQMLDTIFIKQNGKDLPQEMVDLGLPSGLLWASCNLGGENPEDYGDHYAWGELIPKNEFSWENYLWGGPASEDISKYNIADGLVVLEPEDDVATVTYGGKWRIPTAAEFEELMDPTNCYWEWQSLNNVNGFQITSKTNGNSIFLPVAGWGDELGIQYSGHTGSYWTSQLCEVYGSPSRKEAALGINILNYSNHINSRPAGYYRNMGSTIRPVYGDFIRAEAIQLSINNTVELSEHSYYLLTPTITPTSASIQTVHWESSDNSIATVTGGEIISIRTGEANISASTTDGAVTTNSNIKVHPVEYVTPGKVDMGFPSGTLWATYNLGATKPEESGVLFAWGELAPKDEYTYDNYRWPWGQYGLEKYNKIDGLTTLQPEDDAAFTILGDCWRIPTKEQVEELNNEDYCTWTESSMNGVPGFTVTSRINGQSLFFPFISQEIDHTEYEYENDRGSFTTFSTGMMYWTSNLYDNDGVFATVFYMGGTTLASRETRGQVIRPVAK